MENTDQLQIPDTIKGDAKAFEVLRVWIAHQGQHISLRAGVWEDPAAWGIMLSDLAKHITNSYHQELGLDRQKTLDRIKAAMDAEFASSTDCPEQNSLM